MEQTNWGKRVRRGGYEDMPRHNASIISQYRYPTVMTVADLKLWNS